MRYTPTAHIDVKLSFDSTQSFSVARLVLNKGRIYFEYDDTFVNRGLELSPIKAPLQKGVQTFTHPIEFSGLPGFIYDSLIDGWSALLFNRAMRATGVEPKSLTALDRLAYVGSRGMGCLFFEPQWTLMKSEFRDALHHLDNLHQQTQTVLDGSSGKLPEELIIGAGSSGGTRPKSLIFLSPCKHKIFIGDGDNSTITPELNLGNLQPWLVKFPTREDGSDAGAAEYVYALMAQQAGLDVSSVHLFSSSIPGHRGYFATQRFDRYTQKDLHGAHHLHRLHMHSACGLLHSHHWDLTLDYRDLIALTMNLCSDTREVEKIYRLAVFNVLAHNRDDHGKNFSFLMDSRGIWRLSPCYDLTHSPGPRGYHSTTIMGEGLSPRGDHLRALAKSAGVRGHKAAEIVAQTREALSQWPKLAHHHGVMNNTIRTVEKSLKAFNDD